MQKRFAVLVAILFFIWILPLGFFIKPAQEKIACGGQRAMCLCSNSAANVKGNPMEGFGLKNNSNNGKEANATGGGGQHYLSVHRLVQNSPGAVFPDDEIFLAYRNPLLKSIEHIPKA